jgi:hypothetical protein
MKRFTTIALLTTGVLLMGLSVPYTSTLTPAKEELKLNEILKDSKTYLSPPAAPFCPSAEYQVTLVNKTVAEGQNMFVDTQHCPKCRMGAIYEKEGVKICTYCESTL